MKKLFLLFAGLFLMTGFAQAGVNDSETKAEAKAAIETVDIVFSCQPGSFGMQFHCPTFANIQNVQLDIWVHNVDINHSGFIEYNVTGWIQMIGGGGGYSEQAPFMINGNSYVDISSIQVSGPGLEGPFNFNITGIPAR